MVNKSFSFSEANWNTYFSHLNKLNYDYGFMSDLLPNLVHHKQVVKG